jgi:predicted RNase H-like HicB family nuclease
MALNLHLDVLLGPDEGGWLAHCLQLDLAEWGETLQAAQANLLDVMRAHIASAVENDNLAYLFHPAPPEVWKRFFQAELIGEQTLALDVPAGVVVPAVRVREASLSRAAA